MTYSSDVAFTDSVKAVQTSKGSRRAYARMEEGGSWETRITPACSVTPVARVEYACPLDYPPAPMLCAVRNLSILTAISSAASSRAK